MIESLYIAESGMNAQQSLIDIISNNIANSATPVFKKSQANFVDLIYSSANLNQQSSLNNNESIRGAGVHVGSVTQDFSVGSIKQTNNPFDIAIQGDGFIEVELQNGELGYTRAGRLRVNNDSVLVTVEGLKLSSNIQVPVDTQALHINSKGQVFAEIDGESQRLELGQIELTKFINNSGLITAGNNVYLASADSGAAIYGTAGELGFGEILQGFSEISNVSMTEEMVNLMLAQRGYQLNARLIQVSDQLLETINNLRR